MRADLRRCATERKVAVAAGIRPFQQGDETGLGVLLYEAYLGTIDQQEETLDQAHAEIRKTLSGDYGDFLPKCSMVLERQGQLLSAVLITRYQNKPFVAFTVTSPAHKNCGLARSCLNAAMSALAAIGEQEIRLVVTLANEPAYHLYKTLGFAQEPI